MCLRAEERASGSSRRPAPAAKPEAIEIPANVDEMELAVSGGTVRLTNLQKVFWPDLGLTKRDLLQYYLSVSPWLLPHLKNRAMVMKRYPNGIAGEFFFMKRAPSPRPPSIPICSIEHGSGNVIGFPGNPAPGFPALGGESRMHRFESLVRALR